MALGVTNLVLGPIGLSAQQIPDPQISAKVPKDVEIPEGFPGDPTVFFDDFSWRSFIALNWPAVVGQRGVADTARGPGGLRVPRVWETWKADYELFQNRESPPPSEWNSFEATTPCEGVTDNQRKILAAFSKIGGFNQAGFGADLGPLIARNRTYVRYEVRLNQPEFQTIFDHQYYLASKLPTQTAPADFADGSIEIKAAWRELKADEPATVQSRYYTFRALVLDPRTKRCDEKEMLLVGFHIVTKTPSRPQWIWSTFEHVDNLPEPDGSPGGQTWSFNDGNPAHQELAPLERGPITTGNLPEPDPDPNQVVRVRPIANSTKDTNAAYRAALVGTVWEHYQLVMTQWPTADLTTPAPSKDGVPFPANEASTNLANTTLETYMQSTSCMRCHHAANRRGFDFVWFMALRAFAPAAPTVPSPTPSVAVSVVASPVANRAAAIEELRAMVTTTQRR
jgi:hypothetical protein